MLRNRIQVLAAGAFLMLWLAVPVPAAVTLIQVSGVFEATQDSDETGLHIFAPFEGQAYTMVFHYDPSVPDSASSNNIGEYYHSVPPHQFTLTSASVTLSEPSTYRLHAYAEPGGGIGSYYSFASRSDVSDVAGMTLPGNIDALQFGLIHPVSDSVVDFLDNGSADDPLPQTPFFLGLPTTGAYVYINLATYDADLDEYYDDGIYATVTSIQVIPGPSSGDADGDGDVDLDDYANMEACLSGPHGGVGAGCKNFDFDADGDVDLSDFAKFQVMFTGS